MEATLVTQHLSHGAHGYVISAYTFSPFCRVADFPLRFHGWVSYNLLLGFAMLGKADVDSGF